MIVVATQPNYIRSDKDIDDDIKSVTECLRRLDKDVSSRVACEEYLNMSRWCFMEYQKARKS